MATITLGVVTEILDSSAGDNGAQQKLRANELGIAQNAFVEVIIGSGDTVVIEGNLSGSTTVYQIIATFTASTLTIIDLPPTFRARRTVDGGGADSTVDMQLVGTRRPA